MMYQGIDYSRVYLFNLIRTNINKLECRIFRHQNGNFTPLAPNGSGEYELDEGSLIGFCVEKDSDSTAMWSLTVDVECLHDPDKGPTFPLCVSSPATVNVEARTLTTHFRTIESLATPCTRLDRFDSLPCYILCNWPANSDVETYKYRLSGLVVFRSNSSTAYFTDKIIIVKR